MRTDFVLAHVALHGMTRREAVEPIAKARAVGALAGVGVGAQSASAGRMPSRDGGGEGSTGPFTDEMFDVEAVLGGAWDDTAFYRRGDQRGTLQEVTPKKTRDALKVLDGGRPVVTYNLGELMFNGFPAFPSSPPRVYDQRLLVLGFEPPPGYDGILQSPTPLGPATYRITLEDLETAMRRARIKTIERGDVVLIRTGWNQLLEPHDPTSPHAPDDPTHPGHPGHQTYLRSEPGIYLREARWLASHRPAIVGADSWALEVAGDPVVGPNVFPVHQELITHFGIRIGEAIVTDRVAEDRVFEFVYIVTPQFAFGATAGNTPPCALGQPRHRLIS
jgi:Putative cyclase